MAGSRSTAITRPRAASARASPPIPEQRSTTVPPAGEPAGLVSGHRLGRRLLEPLRAEPHPVARANLAAPRRRDSTSRTAAATSAGVGELAPTGDLGRAGLRDPGRRRRASADPPSPVRTANSAAAGVSRSVSGELTIGSGALAGWGAGSSRIILPALALDQEVRLCSTRPTRPSRRPADRPRAAPDRLGRDPLAVLPRPPGGIHRPGVPPDGPRAGGLRPGDDRPGQRPGDPREAPPDVRADRDLRRGPPAGDPDLRPRRRRDDPGRAVGGRPGAAVVDINMGCPVNKVVRSGGGSALMNQATPPRSWWRRWSRRWTSR